jgi:hypothetical protein
VSLEHLVDKRLGVDSGGEPGGSAQDRALRERMRLAILDEANVVSLQGGARGASWVARVAGVAQVAGCRL